MLFWSKFDVNFKKCWCDLKNKIKVTKFLSTLYPLPSLKNVAISNFSHNPLTNAEDKSVRKADILCLKVC